SAEVTLEELGLSSLERVELLLAIERRFGVTIDEAEFSGATTVGELRKLVSQEMPAAAAARVSEPVKSPAWNRSRPGRWVRRTERRLSMLALGGVCTGVQAHGLETLEGLQPAVISAPNHQSQLEVPALMPALPPWWRYRSAPD